MKHPTKRAWTKYGLVALVTALIVAPTAAIASHGFTDVPDTNIFHNNIQWMKDNGVTAGCNPPANDQYCPSKSVTRGQMAAFMQRLAENKVVDAATAVTAETSTNSDKLDGLNSTDFTRSGDIQMVYHSGHMVNEDGTPLPTLLGFAEVIDTAGLMPLDAPAVVGGVEYGLASLEYCVTGSSASVNGAGVIQGQPPISVGAVIDTTVRVGTDDFVCYDVTIGYGGADTGTVFIITTTGSIFVLSVTATWSPSAVGTAPKLLSTGSAFSDLSLDDLLGQ